MEKVDLQLPFWQTFASAVRWHANSQQPDYFSAQQLVDRGEKSLNKCMNSSHSAAFRTEITNNRGKAKYLIKPHCTAVSFGRYSLLEVEGGKTLLKILRLHCSYAAQHANTHTQIQIKARQVFGELLAYISQLALHQNDS